MVRATPYSCAGRIFYFWVVRYNCTSMKVRVSIKYRCREDLRLAIHTHLMVRAFTRVHEQAGVSTYVLKLCVGMNTTSSCAYAIFSFVCDVMNVFGHTSAAVPCHRDLVAG